MRLSVDFVNRLPKVSTDQIRQKLEASMLQAGKSVQRAWVTAAQGRNAPKTYVQGVRNASVAVTRSIEEDQQIEVQVTVKSAMEGSAFVDRGHGAFHLPSRVSWPSAKTHVDSKGRMYINVPLPQATAVIPTAILRRARKLRRLTSKTAPPRWAGLFRGARSWLVIRRLYAGSPGWRIPAQKGKAIVDEVRAMSAEIVTSAIKDVLR